MTNFHLDEVKNILSESRKIVITTHVSPDGDAIGSSLAMYLFLKNEGHDPTVVTPDTYPSFLHWLPKHDEVLNYDVHTEEATEKINEASLIICLDFNTTDRMGDLREIVESKDCKKILIDHHQDPDDWADVMICDSDASSTAELVYNFIIGLNGSLDKDIGSCLYTGIVTDTGSFKFPSTSSSTLEIASKLMDEGVDAPQIQNLIYDNSSLDRLRLLGYALTEKLKVISEYCTAIIGLDKEELDSFNYQKGDTEGIVNYPLSIDTVKLSIFISQKNDEVRLSFRSKGKIPVHEIAAKHFSGGGHMNAAGGISDLSVADTISKIEQILPEYSDFLC